MLWKSQELSGFGGRDVVLEEDITWLMSSMTDVGVVVDITRSSGNRIGADVVGGVTWW